MTVASSTARVSYSGNGSTKTFAVNFYFLEESHLQVIIRAADGTETVKTLTTDYTVAGEGNPAGGSITFLSAPANGETVVIVRNLPLTQQTDYLANDPFPAESHEEALDKLTMLVQQLNEQVERSAKLPITSTANADALVADIVRIADSADNIDTVATNIANVNTVAGNTANINTVAGNTANINTVATNIASVNTNATNIASINTNASNIVAIQNASANAATAMTQAGIATTQAGIATTQADIATTQASNAANSAAQAAASVASGMYSAVQDKSANYTVAAADAGDLIRVITTGGTVTITLPLIGSTGIDDGFKIAIVKWTGDTNAVNIARSGSDTINGQSSYTIGSQYTSVTLVADAESSQWFVSTSGLGTTNAVVDVYSGTGSQTAFTLSGDPGSKNNTNVYISGIYQAKATYSVSGSTLTFTSAPPSGTNNIEVQWIQPLAIGVPSDGSVTTNKLADASVTTNKLADASVTASKLADSNLSSAANRGLFKKADSTIVAWTKTGNGTATTATTLYVEVNGNIKTIASGTSIIMPTLSAGTDYAIWAKTDGTLEATSNHTSPPTANARKVGGFHYAPGGNASAQSGGNTTAQINEYSFWDLKWRPTAPDPRGMTLVAGGFWSDIYLTGVDAITNGSSKYNVTIGDGSSPPKVPTMFGGNGTTTYGSYTWFEAMELATAFGKKCPTQMEFMSLAYGTTEATSSGGTDVPTTGVTGTGATSAWNVFTSKWGVIQSSGCMWVWTRDRGGPAAAASWNANTEGRGSEYNAPNAGRLGGSWAYGSLSGSRCSDWSNAASASRDDIGSRFVCDHLQLD